MDDMKLPNISYWQVELLERAKFELLMENAEVDNEANVNEVILEFASMALLKKRRKTNDSVKKIQRLICHCH